MSHVINIQTNLTKLEFLVSTLKSLELEFEITNIEQRSTIIIKNCNMIHEGAFIWNGQNFSFISDPIWSNEEQINRFLVNVSKIYNKISFVKLANQSNFVPIKTKVQNGKQTIGLERYISK